MDERELHAKRHFLIRHEQGLESRVDREMHWQGLSDEDQRELTRRATESDFYKVKLTQHGTDNTVMVVVAAPLGTPYADVVQQTRDGKLKPF